MKMIDVKWNRVRRYTVRKPLRKCPAFMIVDKKTAKVTGPVMVCVGFPPADRYAFLDRRDAWKFLRDAEATDSEETRIEKFTAAAQSRIVRTTVAVVELFRHQEDFPGAAIAVRFPGKPEPVLVRGKDEQALLTEIIEQQRRGGTIVGIITEHDLAPLPVGARGLPTPETIQ